MITDTELKPNISREGNGPPLRVYVIDDSSMVRRSTFALLSVSGFQPRSYLSGADFLADAKTLTPGCVLLDLQMPELDGIQVLEAMQAAAYRFPVIMVTGHGDIGAAVRAMKLGAVDFIEKPYEEEMLIATLTQAFKLVQDSSEGVVERTQAEARIAKLTDRERDVLMGLVAGLPNKRIALLLDISARTVEMHRANLTRRLGVASLSDVLKIAFDGKVPPLRARAQPDRVRLGDR